MQEGPLLANRYRILRRLSDGAVGAVWLAEDQQTGFFVLASVLPMSRARLLRTAVGLQHPHVAALIDLLDHDAAGTLPDNVKLDRGSRVAIAEWISGTTLHDLLLDGRMSLVPAVRTVASIASAVSALHARGAVHGAISTRAIVVERADGGTAPILTHGAVPADGSFCSLPRLDGQGPSEEDDLWALHVVLYNALTGRRPYRAKSQDALVRALRNARPIPIAALDVDDPALNDIVQAALVPVEGKPPGRVSDLEASLYRWLAEHGDKPSPRDAQGNDTSPPVIEIGSFLDSSLRGVRTDMPSMMPPPARIDLDRDAIPATPVRVGRFELSSLPSSETPEPATTQIATPTAGGPVAGSADPVGPSSPELAAPPLPDVTSINSATPTAHSSSPTRRDVPPNAWALPLVAVLGAAAIAGGVWTVNTLRTRTSAPPVAPAAGRLVANAPSAPSSSSSIEAPPASASIAAIGSAPPARQRSTPADIAACTARWFPPQTFGVGQDLSFVCSVRDPRDAAKRMRRRVVVGARGSVTPGMREWSRLGWYQLATLATIRGDCCPSPAPFELPALQACPRLDATLDGLASAIRNGTPLDPAVAAFEEAAACAYRVQPQDYGYAMTPKSGGQFAFDDLLARGGR